LHLLRQGIVFFFESLAKLIGVYSFSHFSPSSAVWNFGDS
jgi:hypothetical protein